MLFARASRLLLWTNFLMSLGLVLGLGMPTWGQDQADSVKVNNSPVRTWSSPDGKFKREGKLTEILGDRVRLEMQDGKSTVAQASKLSSGDQAFIAAERARMAATADSPFMDEESSEENASGGNNVAGSDAAGSGKEIDIIPEFTTVSVVDLETSATSNSEATLWKPAERKPVKRFRIPAYSVHSRVTGHACSPGQVLFAVTMHEPFGVDPNAGGGNRRGGRSRQPAEEGPKVKSWIDIVDLAAAKTKARFPLPVEEEVVADLDDQANLLVTFDGNFSQDPKVRVYTVTNDGLVLRKSWAAKGPDDFRGKVRSARLLPEKRLLVEYEEYLMVMQLDPVEALFKIPNDSTDWQLSNDRSRAMVTKQGRKYEVDLKAGECLGAVGGAVIAGSGSPSPDGSRLAKFENGVLTLRDEQSKLLDEFYCPLFWPNPQLSWLDDRTILLQSPHQQHFVDLDRRVVFLEIANASAPQPSNGWIVEKISDAGAQIVQVAQASVENKSGPNLAEYQQDLPADAESLLLLKSGDSVRITTQLAADPSQESVVRQRLGTLLQQRGVSVDPNASNELRVSSGVRNDQVEYRTIGAPPWAGGGTQSVNVRLVDQKVELVVDGEVVWQKASTSGPGFMLQIRDGESAQQAADRQSGDGAGFWQSITFPKNLARHPQGGPWNRVMQTGNGYQRIN
jgi:hypothetical protein